MWRILEVQEASQRKSLKGLNNTAADSDEGFEALNKMVDPLEEIGAYKEWSSQTRKKLKESKLYHCYITVKRKAPLPDHCRVFALSDAGYQSLCNHEHDHVRQNCEVLKDVIQEIQCSVSEHPSKINDKGKEDNLRCEADIAEIKVKEWKAHIIKKKVSKTFFFLYRRTRSL